MHPATREQWAETWGRWLKPGGELVTLMFPVEPEGREGPPWPVPLQLYDQLLPPQGSDTPYKWNAHIGLSQLNTKKISCPHQLATAHTY